MCEISRNIAGISVSDFVVRCDEVTVTVAGTGLAALWVCVDVVKALAV